MDSFENDNKNANDAEIEKLYSVGDFNSSEISAISSILKSLTNEQQDNQILRENALLRQELEQIRIQLSDQRMENLQLKSKIQDVEKNLEDTSSNSNKAINILQPLFVQAITYFLQCHSDKVVGKLKVFESIFGCFHNDADFMCQMQNLDNLFAELLNQRYNFIFKNEILKMNSKIHEEEERRRQKLCEKFRAGIKMENWAKRLELQLSSIRLISELRDAILKHSRKKGRRELLQALQNIERNLKQNN